MDARERGAQAVFGMRASSVEQRLVLRQQPLHVALPGAVGVLLLPCRQVVVRAGELFAHAGDPVGGIVCIGNAHTEVRVFGGRGQRRMQFAQPRANHADEVDVARQRLVGIHARFRDGHRGGFSVAGSHAFHLHGQFVDGASQIVQRPGPGIALVGNEALHDGQRGAFAVGCVVRYLANQRRRVGIADTREVARHLHLGVDARCDTADELDDDRLANHQRAVRLLGRQPLDGRVGRQR